MGSTMFMKKKVFATIIALVLVVGVLSAEAGVGFIGGVSVGGGSVVASGKGAGCGHGNCEKVTMHIEGTDLTAWCQNNGGNFAPGQNTITVDINTTTTFPVDANGQFLFTVSEEILPTKQEAGCPNGNWRVVDLTGPITVTMSLYETGVSTPADVQVFDCLAVFGAATQCVRVQ